MWKIIIIMLSFNLINYEDLVLLGWDIVWLAESLTTLRRIAVHPSIFKCKQSKKNFTLEVEGRTIFRNVGSHSPNDMASHTRRLESSTTPLEET